MFRHVPYYFLAVIMGLYLATFLGQVVFEGIFPRFYQWVIAVLVIGYIWMAWCEYVTERDRKEDE